MEDKERGRIRKIIFSVLQERFEDVTIESIEIEPDVDADGDKILRVRVVFDKREKQLDGAKTASVLRHLRPKMEEIGVSEFPVISYVAKSDIRKSRAATA